MFKNFLFVLIIPIAFGCINAQPPVSETIIPEEEILDIYLVKGARKYSYLSKEWDDWISRGLEADSTIAYLWQQKALPYWKQKKYSQAIKFYDKAVELDPERWLSRLGFLKCIFAKDYPEALLDLIAATNTYGSIYEQDHSLKFYMGICHLQMDEYEKALGIMEETVSSEILVSGAEWVHYLDYYYLGICHYELGNYEKAIMEFNNALQGYPTFSDAQYYKSISLKYLGKHETAKALMKLGKLNHEKGNSFNEDSSVYEDYPYQITWQWRSAHLMLKTK